MLIRLHRVIDDRCWRLVNGQGNRLNTKVVEWLEANGCQRLPTWVAVQVLDPSKVMVPCPWGDETQRMHYLVVPRDLAEKILAMGIPE